MDLLKQLEAKLQSLVQQRNALKEEVDRLKDGQGQELEQLRSQLAQALQESADLRAERETILRDVEAILQMVEGLG